jgi:hypothetical protein
MVVRAALLALVAVAVAAGCGPDCGGLAKQIHAIVAGPSRCVVDGDCAVFVGFCISSADGCGAALDAADRERLDQLQHQYIDAASPTDPNPGAGACRIGTQAGVAACSDGACVCMGGSCLVLM